MGGRTEHMCMSGIGMVPPDWPPCSIVKGLTVLKAVQSEGLR
jgi:hypothetical protein